METEENLPPHKGLKKGLYLLPTAFTAANVGMGFITVLYSIKGFQLIPNDPAAAASYFNLAALAIGLAILFDTLDGRVARATRTATEIGVQLDSLADVVTFGIGPIALVFAWGIGSVFKEQTGIYNLGVFLLFAYLMCGAFRLARFNLQATRPRVLIEGSTKIDKKHFVGLPIPPAAGLMASIIHFSPEPLSVHGPDYARFYGIMVLVLLGLLGVLMVSTIRYSSFKTVGSSRTNIYMVLLVAAVAMMIWFYSQYALLVLSIVYVSHGVIWYILGILSPKRRAEEGLVESETTN